MDPPTPQRAAVAPPWLPPRHALPPGAAPVLMLPFGHPGGWLPVLPVVGAAPAPARGVAPAPAGWVPLPVPRGAAAAPAPAGWLPFVRPRGAAAAPAPAGWLPLPLSAPPPGRALPFVRPPGRALPRFVRPPPVVTPPVVTPPVTPPHEQKRRAIPFVAQLKRMIEERPEIIRWRRGDIVIPDPAALERNLSKYYKHSKYASFQRQLNNFGYRRRFVDQQAAETVYERQGASENLDDLLALRPVRPAPGGVKKRGRDEPPASPPHQRVRVAAAPPAAFDAAASLLALGAS